MESNQFTPLNLYNRSVSDGFGCMLYPKRTVLFLHVLVFIIIYVLFKDSIFYTRMQDSIVDIKVPIFVPGQVSVHIT